MYAAFPPPAMRVTQPCAAMLISLAIVRNWLGTGQELVRNWPGTGQELVNLLAGTVWELVRGTGQELVRNQQEPARAYNQEPGQELVRNWSGNGQAIPQGRAGRSAPHPPT